jgi:hypothetical protein
MDRDAAEDIAEVGEGLYADEPAALGEGVQQGRSMKAGHTACEEPVSSDQGPLLEAGSRLRCCRF